MVHLNMGKGFTCKQFVIEHDHCAMKVNTDSLVLGSWADAPQGGKALDIGCGSGILSLMLRQRMGPGSRVDALDINEGAVHQTRCNAAASPWPDDIAVTQTDVRLFETSCLYDVVVCNPPYFTHGQVGRHAHLAQSQARQQARQQDSLSAQQLFGSSAPLLRESGTLCCLYPTSMAERVIRDARQCGLYLQRQLVVFPTPDKPSHVTAFCFARQQKNHVTKTELVIRDAQNSYSDNYRELCRSFYLAF